jgi:hypothetical protein
LLEPCRHCACWASEHEWRFIFLSTSPSLHVSEFPLQPHPDFFSERPYIRILCRRCTVEEPKRLQLKRSRSIVLRVMNLKQTSASKQATTAYAGCMYCSPTLRASANALHALPCNRVVTNFRNGPCRHDLPLFDFSHCDCEPKSTSPQKTGSIKTFALAMHEA